MKKPDNTQGTPVQREAECRPLAQGPVYSSDQLMGDSHEIVIAHGGTSYRLRRTAQGKLILTK